jgi:hypothetical protein
MRIIAAGTVMAVMLAGGPAAAKAAGDIGITMGYPAAIGVVWHITDAVAIRPDVSMTWTSSESVTTTVLPPGAPPVTSTSMVDAWNTAVGISALFYLQTADRFRVYLVPRAAYLRSTQDLQSGGLTTAIDTTSNGYLLSGSVGAQVAAHDRFSIFGELGVQYSTQRSEVSFSSSRSENENRTFGLRSAVGVTVYF